jgi:hypothetical protein
LYVIRKIMQDFRIFLFKIFLGLPIHDTSSYVLNIKIHAHLEFYPYL